MRRLVTYLGVGVVAQVACVAVALWMHDRFLLLVATRGAEENASAALTKIAEPLAAAARELDPSSQMTPSELRRMLDEAAIPSHFGLLIVDNAWRVTLARSADEHQSPRAGDQIDWHARPFTDPTQIGDSVAGSFETRAGPQWAVACHLPHEVGFIIAYRPASDLAVRPADLAASTPFTGVITFLWLSGLLAMCTFMSGKRLYDELVAELDESQDRALRREQALLRTRDAVIFGLAKLAESRDSDTGEHVERMSLYCQRLSAALRRRPEYRETVTPAFVRLIEASSALHDIGKVGIADAILHKPGPLTTAERSEVQKHAVIGSNCLAEIEQRLGASNFLQMAREIAHCHHERWDGGGYPAGLKGEDIPLPARIVAIADNYDALVSRRPYKEAFPHDKVVAMIRDGAGTQFDPKLVEVFLEIEQEFREIAEQYAAARRLSAAEQSAPPQHSESPEPHELVGA